MSGQQEFIVLKMIPGVQNRSLYSGWLQTGISMPLEAETVFRQPNSKPILSSRYKFMNCKLQGK
jgi:hypothetical protein